MPKEKVNILGGIADLTIFLLFVVGAGFFGYFVGINQKLAPVQMVAPGTIEALKKISDSVTGKAQPASHHQSQTKNPKIPPVSHQPSNDASNPSVSRELQEKSKSKEASAKKEVSTKKNSNKNTAKKQTKKQQKTTKKINSKQKYWIASTGDEYIGSAITVSVNGHPIDQFFGPGKLVDITKKVVKGQNQIRFDSKVLADEYNQHLGNSKYNLTLHLVSGDNIRENVDAKSVLLSYSRTAAQTDNETSALNFKAK